MLVEDIKLFLVREALKKSIKIFPYLNEEKVLKFINSRIESFINPPARNFFDKFLRVSFDRLKKASPECRQGALTSFFINAEIMGLLRRRGFEEKNGIRPPFTILISPTMRCNLQCIGCYASKYSKKEDLEFEVIDRIIREANELGCYVITILGGEPFIREDLFEIFKLHKDTYFQVFTNATLINEKLADEIAGIGNIYPCISIDGLEEYTDIRRGKGTFKKLVKTMDLLRERGVIFGYSTMVTRENNELVVSDDFIDFLVDKNCFMGWYFAYMPVGKNPDLSLMPTPEQRLYRLKRINAIRDTKNIIISDFWNDAPLVGGCIAAGNQFLHINNNGDIEPCIFVHFAVDNIKEKSLKEAFFSPLFTGIRKRQPYNENLLMPCMIIDNPHILREVVKESGAKPTHSDAHLILEDEMAVHIDDYASKFSNICAPAWTEYVAETKYKKVGI